MEKANPAFSTVQNTVNNFIFFFLLCIPGIHISIRPTKWSILEKKIMGRKKKPGFTQMKMLASRVEESDYNKFDLLTKNRDGKRLQEVINLFVTEYISGNIQISGSGFAVGEINE